MLPPEILPTLLSGFILGSLYALMSTGISIIWSTTGLINWAHGALITLGGYISWYIYTSQIFGANFIFAFLVTVSILFIVGTLLEFTLFRPIRGQPDWDLRSVFITLALGVSIQSLLTYIFNPRAKSVPPIMSGSIPIFGSLMIQLHQFFIFIIAVVSLISFSIFLKKSKIGMAITAISQDITGAQIVGISVNKVYAYTIGIGAAMAGIAGALLGSIYFISPIMGNEPLFKGFIIIVFGGMGSLEGTICASFITGLIEALVQQYISPFWVLPALFIIMIAILIIRPHGIGGRKEAVK